MHSASSDEDLVLIVLSKKRKRRFWVYLLLQSRDRKEEFHLLIAELKLYHSRFLVYFRLSGGTVRGTFTDAGALSEKTERPTSGRNVSRSV